MNIAGGKLFIIIGSWQLICFFYFVIMVIHFSIFKAGLDLFRRITGKFYLLLIATSINLCFKII